MKTFSEARAFSFLALALATLFLAFVFVAYATSIGSDVTVTGALTGQGVNVFSGQLQASSTALLGGAATFYSTAGIGTATPAQAFSVQGNALISGNLTSVANVTATGTLNVTGLTTLVSATTTHIGVTGTASTTNLVVGGGGSTIAGIIFGFCNIPNTSITASTTKAVLCSSATGVAVNDRVFVTATSSLPTNLILLSASSTAANTIGLYIHRLDTSDGATATGNISLNFISIR